jgi:hypothetical protein
MIPPPTAPPNPAWIAVAVSALGVIVTICGWFVVNSLAKRRELQRDREAREHALAVGIAERKRDLIKFLAGWQSEFERAQIPYEITQTFDERAKQLRSITAIMVQDYSDGNRREKFCGLVTAITDFPLNHVSAPQENKHLFESIRALERFTMES